MPDLIDDPHPEFTAAMMADLTGAGMAPGSPETASVRLSEGPAVSEWPKDRNGPPRLSCGHPLGPTTIAAMERVRAGGLKRYATVEEMLADTGADDEFTIEADIQWLHDEGVITTASVANLYTAALRVMGPDPIPLAGTEPWAESDEAYRKRLGYEFVAWPDDVHLDYLGDDIDLPRARLVPVQQEP